MLQCLFVKQVALLRFAAGVTYHSGGSAYQRQRLVTATLEMTKYHYTAQMPYVKGVGSRVKTHISSYLLLAKKFIGTRHHLVDHASPGKFFNKISHYSMI